MNEDEKIEVGDTVYLGNGVVHWIVKQLTEGTRGEPWAVLKSGMMGGHRQAKVSKLRLHSKGTVDA